MVRGLYTAWTGMLNEQKRLDVISNNLANANTTAYKTQGVTSQYFDEQLAIKINDKTDTYLQRRIGSFNLGVKIGETYNDYTQGNLKETGNSYDLALEGSGFFTVSTTDKNGDTHTRYTRDGSFTLNAEGYLVTKDGDYLLGNKGNRIQIPNSASATVTIDFGGNVYANNTLVSNLDIVDFENMEAVSNYGENMYEATDEAGIKDSTAKVQQGYLETSNVNVVSEMVDMISITRAYETNQKMIQTVDKTLDKAVNDIGRI